MCVCVLCTVYWVLVSLINFVLLFFVDVVSVCVFVCVCARKKQQNFLAYSTFGRNIFTFLVFTPTYTQTNKINKYTHSTQSVSACFDTVCRHECAHLLSQRERHSNKNSDANTKQKGTTSNTHSHTEWEQEIHSGMSCKTKYDNVLRPSIYKRTYIQTHKIYVYNKLHTKLCGSLSLSDFLSFCAISLFHCLTKFFFTLIYFVIFVRVPYDACARLHVQSHLPPAFLFALCFSSICCVPFSLCFFIVIFIYKSRCFSHSLLTSSFHTHLYAIRSLHVVDFFSSSSSSLSSSSRIPFFYFEYSF